MATHSGWQRSGRVAWGLQRALGNGAGCDQAPAPGGDAAEPGKGTPRLRAGCRCFYRSFPRGTVRGLVSTGVSRQLHLNHLIPMPTAKQVRGKTTLQRKRTVHARSQRWRRSEPELTGDHVPRTVQEGVSESPRLTENNADRLPPCSSFSRPLKCNSIRSFYHLFERLRLKVYVIPGAMCNTSKVQNAAKMRDPTSLLRRSKARYGGTSSSRGLEMPLLFLAPPTAV